MQTNFVFLGSSRISYSWWGTGKKLLLCLHGYGESATSFALLEQALGKEFTILAPDLPFHGGTQWKDRLYFDPAQFTALMEEIIARLPVIGDLPVTDALPLSVSTPAISGPPGIAGQPGMAGTPAIDGAPATRFDRWWVMGYSMGGRVALSLLEYVPEKIAKLILLAPDGFKMNGWYWLATQSRPGNLAFRRVMHRPHSLFRMLRIAGKLKLLNPGIHKFMFRYIEDPQVREELYDRWTVMRGFKPNIRSVRSIIRERQIPIDLLYGRHDHIIRAATGERFRKGIEPWCRIHVLDAGHGLLQPKFLDTIIALLKD
jgi:pimeloyl-ACP methyl ester carboxylesterase